MFGCGVKNKPAFAWNAGLLGVVQGMSYLAKVMVSDRMRNCVAPPVPVLVLVIFTVELLMPLNV